MTGVLWLILAVAAQLCGASESSCESAADFAQEGSDCSAFLQSSTRHTMAPKEPVSPEKIGSGSQMKAGWPGIWRPWLKQWRHQRHRSYYNVDNAPSDNGDNAPAEEGMPIVDLIIFLEVPYGQGRASEEFLRNFTEDNETFNSGVTSLVGSNLTDCDSDFLGLDFSAFDDMMSFKGDPALKLKLAQIKQANGVKVRSFEGDLLIAVIICKLQPEASIQALESSLESSSLAADYSNLLSGLGLAGIGQAELVDIDLEDEDEADLLQSSSQRSDPEPTAATEQVAPEKIGSASQGKASFNGAVPNLHHWFKRWKKHGQYYNVDNAPSDGGDNASDEGEGLTIAQLLIAVEVADGQAAEEQLKPLLAEVSSNVSAIFGSPCPVMEVSGFEMSAFDDTSILKGHAASLLAEIKQSNNAKVKSFDGDLLAAIVLCLHPSETVQTWVQGLEDQKDSLADDFKDLLVNLGLDQTNVWDAAITGIRTETPEELE